MIERIRMLPDADAGRKKRFGVEYYYNGARKRPRFQTLEDRELFLQDLRERQRLSLLSGSEVEQEDIAMLRRCREVLPAQVTILEACLEYARNHAAVQPMDLEQAIDLFAIRRKQLGISEGRIRAGDAVFEALRGGFSGAIGNISERALAEWILGLPWAAETKRSYRSHICSFFEFCTAQGWYKDFSAKRIPTIRTVEKEAVILPLADVKKLMKHAWAEYPMHCAYLALGLFGGLRTVQCVRLEYANISFEERGILLPAETEKTRKRHYIDAYHPILWEWLNAINARCGRAAFGISAKEWQRRRAEIAAGAGVEIPQNGLRKSYASYALAATADASWVATTMTHRNTTKLYQTYKGNAKKADGVKYFKIRPAKI